MNSAAYMQLKAKLKKYAITQGIPPEAIFQIYLIDRFLERLAKYELKNHFVIKGGVLMARLAAVSTRATQDVDVTLVDLPLTEEKIRQMIQEICAVPLEDDTKWEISDIQPIRDDDSYGGFRVKLHVSCFSNLNSIEIDFSTGDVLTPGKQYYEFRTILMNELIGLFGYSLETVLAEKIESILSRGILNTRMKDFFDVYWILKNTKFSKETFQQALQKTAEHRSSLGVLPEFSEILESLKEDSQIKSRWENYRKKYEFAKRISVQEILVKIQNLLETL